MRVHILSVRGRLPTNRPFVWRKFSVFNANEDGPNLDKDLDGHIAMGGISNDNFIYGCRRAPCSEGSKIFPQQLLPTIPSTSSLPAYDYCPGRIIYRKSYYIMSIETCKDSEKKVLSSPFCRLLPPFLDRRINTIK